MLIAIDIGNSSINIGFFNGEELIVRKMDTYPLLPPSGYSDFLEKSMDKAAWGRVTSVIITSVVPGHTPVVEEGAKKLTGKEPLIAGHSDFRWMRFSVEAPEEVGVDRLAGAAAAARLFGPPVAVVDFGTATTVNFVGGGGVFKGGAILPGVKLMGSALSSGTARLPGLMLTAEGKKAVTPLGKDTEGAILSGILLGTAGAVERIIAGVEAEEGEIYKVAVTGGYMKFVLPHLKRVDFTEPALVLKGLKIVGEGAA